MKIKFEGVFVVAALMTVTTVYSSDLYAKTSPTTPSKSVTSVKGESTATSTSMVEGKIISLDLKALSLKVMTNDNKEVTLMIHPVSSSVNWGYTGISFSQLTPDSQVKVETFMKDGSEYIKKVEVIYLEKNDTPKAAAPAPVKENDKAEKLKEE